MSDVRCVIWDVDGTLVDSEDLIQQAMRHAYERVGAALPSRAAVRSLVGLSLEMIFPRLSPELATADHAALAKGYRDAYAQMRAKKGSDATSPFYPGIRAVLEELRSQDWTLMAVATGKSRRGLDALIAGHGLQNWFQSEQCADHHPSKPHPAMIEAVLAETGASRARTVMIGDTSFDMEMGRAAGVATIGVGWGFHAPDTLGADVIAERVDALPAAIDHLTGGPT